MGKFLDMKPTYESRRQFTRNGNRMQRWQIYEKDPAFQDEKRIAIVFDERDANQLVEFLNSLPKGTNHRQIHVEWYERHDIKFLQDQQLSKMWFL